MSADRPRALVSGASIAGLSAAFWLFRVGWDVTIVERSPEFREGGQNVDVRGTAREVLSRMGLFEEVKARNTTETDTVLIGSDGEVSGTLPGGGDEGATAELEVLRGDLARILRDALPDDVTILLGDHICEVEDRDEHAVVVTEHRARFDVDLLVIAEGVRSTTRDLVFDDVDRRSLEVNMAFGTIPRTDGDDSTWRWYTTTGGRQVHLRPDNHGTTRAILAYAGDDDLASKDIQDALEELRERFADAGWQAPRVLEGFATSGDVYVDHLTQIRMRTWHRGRVCLVGDSGWCVTPMGGGGASLALVGGYVLAAFLQQHVADLEAALEHYEEWMRPMVDEAQKAPPGMHLVAFPRTRLGLLLREVLNKVITSSAAAPLAERLTDVAESTQPLPDL